MSNLKTLLFVVVFASPFTLSRGSVAFYTLAFLQHAATDYADWEEKHPKGNGCRWEVVLYGPSTVGTVVSCQVLVLRLMLLPAAVTPAVHHISRLANLCLLCTLAHGSDLHAEQAFTTALSDTFCRFGCSALARLWPFCLGWRRSLRHPDCLL